MHPSENKIQATEELQALLMDRLLSNVDPEQASLIKVKALWPNVAGNLASHCLPVAIRGEQLIVRTEHSVYQQELRMHADTILSALSRQISNLPLKKLKVERGRVSWAEPDMQKLSHNQKVEKTEYRTSESKPDRGDRLEDLL